MTKIVKKIFQEDINYIKSTRNDKYSNIAKDFIEPCLSECEYFRRDTGWFRSSALKAWVGALQHLIEKDEKEIRLEYLCSPVHRYVSAYVLCLSNQPSLASLLEPPAA